MNPYRAVGVITIIFATLMATGVLNFSAIPLVNQGPSNSPNNYSPIAMSTHIVFPTIAGIPLSNILLVMGSTLFLVSFIETFHDDRGRRYWRETTFEYPTYTLRYPIGGSTGANTEQKEFEAEITASHEEFDNQ